MQNLIMMAGAALMVAFGAASASPQAQLDQCESYCDSVHPLWSTAHQSCVADCYEDYHEATGQGASVDPGWIEHNNQMAEGGVGSDGTQYGEDGSVLGSNAGQCSDQCSFAEPDGRSYRQCMMDCTETNRASIKPPTMIAQPTGNGGFLGGGGQNQASVEGETQLAHNPFDDAGCHMRCESEQIESAYKACIDDCIYNIGAVDPIIESESDVLDAFRDGSKMRTLIARTDPLTIGDNPASCGVDAYGCLLERNDTMSGADLSDAWQTAGAVCINFIFTPNYCCEIKDGVQRCWVE